MSFELLLPEIILAATAVLVILFDMLVGRRIITLFISLAGLATAFGFTLSMWGVDAQPIFNGLFALDNYALFFKLLFLIIAALVMLVSVDYSSRFSRFQAEYHALLLLATLGMMLMSAAADLIASTLLVHVDRLNRRA